MPSSQPLPPKENAFFKRILKCYEQKQYKNGLKFAKQILSNPKYTDHGETLAMKGLTLNCLGRKEEAYEFVRRGLKNDLQSHVCWHVYGLLQRSDKKYDEAIKCYRNALKWEKDSIQILRDLSLLQIQMRDLEGYKETRYQLFQLRPTQRASWIGFAMSYHLLKDYKMALKILEEFRKTQQKYGYDYEHSELLLYQNMVIKESGDTFAGMKHLEEHEELICDKTALLELKGEYYNALKKQEAEEVFHELILRNPENRRYYTELQNAFDLKTSDQLIKLLTHYAKIFPSAISPRRLLLEVAQGDEFASLVDAYMRRALRKGVPALFIDLRDLYKDSNKVAIIQRICTDYLLYLKDSSSFEKYGVKEPATVLLWVYYYMSQHYDILGKYEDALYFINLAIEHTPTLIELFIFKGKIFKHIGDVDEAVLWMDEAQSMDTADRYLNCKCVKYLLRANCVEEAEEMCLKFTREGVSAGENLNEMQCMWFETECALAYQRLGEFGKALKKCIEVDRHFTEIVEDQFDFHTYCMRKMTLRSYVGLLRHENELRSHRFYETAAHCAIEVYLNIYDHPRLQHIDGKLSETDHMGPSELRKFHNKQKKAQRKALLEKQAQAQHQARKELHNKSSKAGGGGKGGSGGGNDEELDAPPKDELLPEKLEMPADPLTEAIKFLSHLQLHVAHRIKTHLLGFQIYYRKGKLLLMLQCIKRALRISDIDLDPNLFGAIILFQTYWEKHAVSISPVVQKVLLVETMSFIPLDDAGENSDRLISPLKRNELFIQQNKHRLHYRLIAGKLMVILEPLQYKEAVKFVTTLDSTVTEVSLQTCTDVVMTLEKEPDIWGDDVHFISMQLDAFKKACHLRYPRASLFRNKVASSNNLTARLESVLKTDNNSCNHTKLSNAHSQIAVPTN